MDDQPQHPARRSPRRALGPIDATRLEPRDRRHRSRGRGSGTVAASASPSRRRHDRPRRMPARLRRPTRPIAGRSSRLIRSPITKTSGWPGSVQSGPHLDAAGAIDRRAASFGDHAARAATPRRPAAQILVAASIRRSRGSVGVVSMPRASTPVTIASRWISTPIRSSARAGAALEATRERARGSSAPASSSTTRASAGSMRRKLRCSERRASSAIWPASSTPVAPGADHDERQPAGAAAGIGLALGQSRTRRRSGRAARARRSIVFMPGAYRANSGWPK